MRRLSPLPLTLFIVASLLLLGLLAALDDSPTTWARGLDDTPTAAAATNTATATEAMTATATITATVATPPPPTDTATATATATRTPAFIHYFPLLRQASGMRLGWRCWPDAPRPMCGPSPTPTPTATPTPTLPTPTALPTETATPFDFVTPTETLVPPSPTPPILSRLNAVTLISALDGWAVGDHGGILNWDGRQWARVISPTNATLNAVSHVGPNDVWAAGDDGVIVHWDGVTVRTVPSGTTSRLTAIDMVSPTDGWAAAAGGDILRWDGQAWRSFASTGGDDPLSIDMLSVTEGWLVGKNGLAMRWNGAQWTKTNVPPSREWPPIPELRAVSILSGTDAWAVGYHPDSTVNGTYEWHAALYHWNGSVWSEVVSPTRAPLYAIAMRAANDGWVVGQQGHIIHWDGRTWSAYADLAPYPMIVADKQGGIPATDQPLRGVAAVSATDAWAVGEGGAIIHWNGQTWTATTMLPLTPTPTVTLTPTSTLTPTVTPTSIPSRARLNSIAMLSPAEGWAVGDGGAILHWNGDTWSYVASPVNANLTAVAAVSAGNTWAVSDAGDTLFWDGSAWRKSMSANRALHAASMPTASEVWAGGGGWEWTYWKWHGRVLFGGIYIHHTVATLMRWDGHSWHEVYIAPSLDPFHPDPEIAALALAPDKAVWIAGVAGSSQTGSRGKILRRDDTRWTETYSVRDVEIRGLAFPDARQGWAVGGSGIMLHWDGQSWVDLPRLTSASLNAIVMTSPTDGWIVGDGGVILRWDGNVWSQVDSPTWANLLAVAPVGPYDGWIVGRDPWNNGVLLRYALRQGE